MTLKKFTPTIRTEQAIDIKTNYKSKLDELADSEGRIETKLNKESLIQAISHKLYRNAESGFRELLNNEIRACQIAKDKFKADPYIKVSLNTLTRNLTIQGFNSLGITEEVFDQILREIGTSTIESKKDGRIPFGMGFFGFLKLSDIAFVQTRCVENGDSYGFMAKGGLFFQKIQKPDFKETGTKIWLTLNEKTNYDKIVETLESITKVSGIRTYFEVNAHKKNINGYGTGLHELKSTSYHEIFEDTIESSLNKSQTVASINNEQIEAYLSLQVDNNGYFSNDRTKQLFLINSPIQAVLDEDDHDNYDYDKNSNDNDDDDDDDEDKEEDYKNSDIDDIKFHSLVINMKNENTFPPHQDRERLTPIAESKLRDIVIELYNKALSSIKNSKCKTLNEWFDHDYKYFISDEEEKIKLNDPETKKIQKLLQTPFNTIKGKVREKPLADLILDYSYNEQRQFNKEQRSFNKNTKLFYITSRSSRIIKVLTENIPNHFLCMISEGNSYLKSNGFIEAKKYIKEHKLKSKSLVTGSYSQPRTKLEGEIILHNKGYDHNAKSIIINDLMRDLKLKKSVIKVDSYDEYSDLVSHFNDIYLVKNEPNNKQFEKLKTPEDVKKEINKMQFLTNYGTLTTDEIIKLAQKKKIIIDMNVDNKNKKLIIRVPKKAKDFKVNKKRHNNIEDSDNKKNYEIIYIGGGIDPKERKEVKDKKFQLLAIALRCSGLKFEIFHFDDDFEDDYDKNKNRLINHYYIKTLDDLKSEVKYLTDGYYMEDPESYFDDVKHFEQYLLGLKEIKEKVKNKTLLKLFSETHDTDNWKERTEQCLEINKQMVRKK